MSNATASSSSFSTMNYSSSEPNYRYPFYFSPQPTLLTSVTDEALTLITPILSYWSLSLFFHWLDTSGWAWLDQYRIHESAEVQKRNRATRTQVVWAVLFQQLIQTLLGVLVLAEPDAQPTDHAANLDAMARTLARVARSLFGKAAGGLIARHGDLPYFMYWWAIPGFQLLSAMFFIDTWQYFLHRGMHMNKFLYKQFHSWHHRLYVPYAFGSLYNHPVEGFALDTLGAFLAETVTFMTTRQAMFLFCFSTLKTVDDHCGYRLPFDPFQIMSGNNADYHDIHHQVIGIKSNFSQPFFVHWDVLLGTRMTRKDIELRRSKIQEREKDD